MPELTKPPPARSTRRALVLALSALAVLLSCGTSAASATGAPCNATDPAPWGTWTINHGAADFGTDDCPSWYRGHSLTAWWNVIEPRPTPLDQPGRFDFKVFDKKLDAITDEGLYAMVQVVGGESVPAWFDPTKANHVSGIGINLDGRTYPRYFVTNRDGSKTLNHKYLAYFHRMVNAFVDHIDKYAHNRDRIIAFGCPIGNTTDPYPYDPNGAHFVDLRHGGYGEFGTNTFIPFNKWQYFQIGTGNPNRGYQGELSWYVDAVKHTNPFDPCLINANSNRHTAQFALDNLPDAWLK